MTNCIEYCLDMHIFLGGFGLYTDFFFMIYFNRKLTALQHVRENDNNPAGIYLFKVNNRKPTTMCEISSKLTIKTPDRRH